jgi:Protein of unknown function (DUF4058)
MPLLDHFHPPLFPTHSWESFHSRWANALADSLDRTLPSRYFAEVQAHLGNRIEADVLEFEITSRDVTNGAADGALAVQTWAPPVAAQSMPALFPDDIEVHVMDTRDGASLVGVIELISPRNKDRAEARFAFAAKCSAYLQRGVGLILIDIVTNRQANLHNELVRLLGHPNAFGLPADAFLYAVAYQPVRREEQNWIDQWPTTFAVGDTLPTLPLALRGGFYVPIDLEATYTDARERCRLQ